MPVLMNLLTLPGDVRALREARARLENETPMRGDCGRLCERACCQPDESGQNGMPLFPHEDWFYRKPIEGFPFRLLPDDALQKRGKRLVCEGACPREHRPLVCRMFPLRARVQAEDGGRLVRAVAELDPRAWAVCPLLERGGMRAMRADFAQAVEEAGAALCGRANLLEALYREQATLDERDKLLG